MPNILFLDSNISIAYVHIKLLEIVALVDIKKPKAIFK